MTSSRGFTLLEVLITLIILAIGLLGLASLQSKMHVTEMESYQRTQAVLLAQDMYGRINDNRGAVESYVTGPSSPLGTGETASCSPTPSNTVGRDMCDWSTELKGAAETKNGGTTQVGAMIGARGCVERIQAINAADGVCQPGIYLISVAWQGLTATVAPQAGLACGKDQYDAETKRRIISTTITIGTPGCVS